MAFAGQQRQVLKVQLVIGDHWRAGDLKRTRALVEGTHPHLFSPEWEGLSVSDRYNQAKAMAKLFYSLLDNATREQEKEGKGILSIARYYAGRSSFPEFENECINMLLDSNLRELPLETSHSESLLKSRKQQEKLDREAASLHARGSCGDARAKLWEAMLLEHDIACERESNMGTGLTLYLDDAVHFYPDLKNIPEVKVVAHYGTFHFPLQETLERCAAHGEEVIIMPCIEGVTRPISRCAVNLRKAIMDGAEFASAPVQESLGKYLELRASYKNWRQA